MDERMGRPKIRHCRGCNAEVEPRDLSWTKLCPVCGYERLEENVIGIASHSGPAFDRWRRAMAASVGAVLLDDVSPPA